MMMKPRPTVKVHVWGREKAFEGLYCSSNRVNKSFSFSETSPYLIPQELLSKAVGAAAKAQMSKRKKKKKSSERIVLFASASRWNNPSQMSWTSAGVLVCPCAFHPTTFSGKAATALTGPLLLGAQTGSPCERHERKTGLWKEE